MAKILISGGPVHAYLDDVKIITNKFKGGLMAQLATEMNLYNHDVDYFCNKGGLRPESAAVVFINHDGIEDYRDFFRVYAKDYDAIILGAAVANLIPVNPIKGKFPSHNYKPGDVIPIDFTIAPRIIDEAKKFMKKGAHLFGFKLLSGATHEELISAAYGIVLESGATTVFANDAKDLQTVYAVTKERGVHKMKRNEISTWICDCMADQYYHTIPGKSLVWEDHREAKYRFANLLDRYRDKYKPTQGGYVFGTIAIRNKNGGFYCTVRGKHEMDGQLIYVSNVDHDKLEIETGGMSIKASLNAPLLDNIFNTFPNVSAVVHYHEEVPGLHTFSYAPAGTVRDSKRDLSVSSPSFNVNEHGCYLAIDADGNVISR